MELPVINLVTSKAVTNLKRVFQKKKKFLLTIHNVRVTILYMYRGYYAILSREEIQFVDGESAVEVGA